MAAIVVPRLGWSMEEGTFVGWLKKDGDSVKAGEPLFTLEGDKASQDVEATESGVLKTSPDSPKAGATVTVGAVLGYLVGDNETTVLEETGTKEIPQVSAGLLTPALCPGGGEGVGGAGEGFSPGRSSAAVAGSTVTISPRARRRAAELGVDFRTLKGSGRSGRIREADVLAAASAAPAPAPSPLAVAPRTAQVCSSVPQLYLRTEVDATALLGLRERLRPGLLQAAGVRLTLSDLLLRAQALALRDCPQANAIWQEGRVVRFSSCDVGLVVGGPDEPLVPVVRGADSGTLASLVKQRVALVEAARAGQLRAEARQGGASSLSNLVDSCVDEFAAVIVSPQSSMLAMGRAAPRPRVVEGQLAIRTTLKLCLSVDPRVMDGGTAARFLGRIVELLEQPTELARE
jgi:pyruvate dehydrogenase E2 component (dihydrolipoamide acetyltransferase)